MQKTMPTDALDTLLSRASNGALVDPAPSGAALEQIMQAGMRAPDHGKLRPWRFVLIAGEARAAFAEHAIAAMLARDPAATVFEQDRMRGKLLAPPLIVALGAEIATGHKIPETEQVQAIAAAAMNILNAAHALGFAGKWVTGPNAYDPAIAARLGVARVIGFLYLGTPAEPVPTPRPPAMADYVRAWTPM